MCVCVCFYLFIWPRSMWDLSSLTRDQIRASCILVLEGQHLHHRTDREVLQLIFYKDATTGGQWGKDKLFDELC